MASSLPIYLRVLD